MKMFVYLKIFPRDMKLRLFVIIYPTSSTGGKQSSSKMSNSDGIAQTNQPFSLKRKKKKSESYEQSINNDEREMRLLCLFSLFFSPISNGRGPKGKKRGHYAQMPHGSCPISVLPQAAPAISAGLEYMPDASTLTKALSCVDCFWLRYWLLIVELYV